MNKYYEHLANMVKTEGDVFIAPNATVIGNIVLKDKVSIWYGAVIRSDFETVEIDEGTNIQDNCILHTDPGKPIRIGKDCIVGHGAIVHGCSVGNNCLIGMRSTIMNNAKIGNFCVIGAHALITEGMEVPDFHMVLGSPGKIIKKLPEEVINRLKWGAEVYKKEMMKYVSETW